MNGWQRIAAERQRQIEVEGWNALHDADHEYGELARAAACYALPPDLREHLNHGHGVPYDEFPEFWPWDREWWKPTPDNRIRELEKAGALIAAEIDRLNRAIEREARGLG